MRLLDLFSGIGGFSLAAEWTWGKCVTAAFCETDTFCRQVLRKNWPTWTNTMPIPIFGDIRTLEVEQLEQLGAIDIITGGFPCQPFSVAGQRRGTEDNRWLWPEMLRVISIVRPRWVIAENVAGFVSMVQFDSVPPVDDQGAAIGEVGDVYTRLGRGVCNEAVASLEAEGYTVQPLIIPACGVGAPHRRNRIWIMAHSQSERQREAREYSERSPERPACSSAVSHSETGRRNEFATQGPREYHRRGQRTSGGRCCPPAHTESERLPNRRQTREQARPQETDRGENTTAGSERCYGAWWASEPGVDRVAYGIPDGVDRIKSLGNAIVPEVAYQIMKAIKEVEEVSA
ncbi:MAG: DNA cytosine methyltransferase [bacterium]|nr:DNA cytosine methyltransferase [bacterium]